MAKKTSKKSKKRGGLTTGRRTTARGGKGKSAKARARSQRIRSAVAGRANQSTARSRRSVAAPARPRRVVERGPGDVGKVDATGGGEAMVP